MWLRNLGRVRHNKLTSTQSAAGLMLAIFNQLDYLTQAKYDDDGNTSWDATHTWTYYANGNRKKENNGDDWTYDELNRILTSPGSVSYGHDILGNRTTKTGGLT